MSYVVTLDENHAEIKKTLLDLGWSVFDTARVGRGFPDLVAGKMGITYLIEVKPLKGKLQQNQIDFIEKWKGSQVKIIHSKDEVLALDALVSNTH